MGNNVNQMSVLQGLIDDGICLNTRSLAKFTAENGVLVNVRCGRSRGRIGLPPKLLGLRPDKWVNETRDFFQGHVSAGQLTMIPKEQESKLNQLDTRVRRLVAMYCINNSYMPLSVYDDFRTEFEEIRTEYLQTVEDVASDWEAITTSFIDGVTNMVNTLGKRSLLSRERDAMLKDIIRSIPSERSYRNSVYMELEVRAFPTTGVPTEGLAPDINDILNQTWRNDVIANAVKAIEAGIGEIFAHACKMAEIYGRSRRMDPRTITTLHKVAVRMKRMNIFRNPMLTAMSSRLSGISAQTPDDDIEVAVEEVILDAISYAEETGLALDTKLCPFTDAQVKSMLSLRQKQLQA